MWILCPDSCIAAAPDPVRGFCCATGRIASQAAQPMYIPMCTTPCPSIHIQLTDTFECGGSFASWRALQWCALVVWSLKLIPITAMLTYMLSFFCSLKLPSWLARSHLKGMHGCGVWCCVHMWVCLTPLYCLPLHCHCLHHITVINRHIAISNFHHCLVWPPGLP